MPTIAQLERLLAADPHDPFVLYGLGQAHAAAGAHELAIEHYRRCADADPAYAYAWFHMARSLDALGRRADALDAIARGVESARRAGDAHALAELEALRDELEDAS